MCGCLFSNYQQSKECRICLEVQVLALVIDDSKAIRLILAQILQDIGYHVIDAADGLEALKLLKEHENVDLILVDWNMPKMNGFEFVLEGLN